MDQSSAAESGQGAARMFPGQKTGPRFREGPTAGFTTGRMAACFCAWRGASDRRYVTSVYPVDRDAGDAGLPGFEAFVLICVARTVVGRHILAVAAVERAGDLKSARRTALARGADEWHVHLLIEDRAARAAMVADIHARHGGAAMAACRA